MSLNSNVGVVACTFTLVRISGPVGYEYGAVARELSQRLCGIYLPNYFVWAVPDDALPCGVGFNPSVFTVIGEVIFLKFDSNSLTVELLEAKIDKLKEEGKLPDLVRRSSPFTDPDKFFREMNRPKPVNVNTEGFKRRLSTSITEK